MSEQSMETEVVSESDIHTLETSLERLWEKARGASETILRLKDENKLLKNRLAFLEHEGEDLRTVLKGHEEEVERLKVEVTRMQTNGSHAFSKDEKEVLKTKIKELISKINAHL